MTKLLTTLLASVAMVAFALSGCSEPPAGKPTPASTATDDGHHEDDGHNHSEHAHPSEGPHAGELIELGNEEYHAELLHPHEHDDDVVAHKAENKEDHKEGDHDHAGVTIYILDGSAKKLVAIEATDVTVNMSHDGKPEQFKLAAMPTKTDPQGKSSRFASADKDLLEHFHEEEIEGTLVVAINGKSYRGKIAHKHDDHGGGHKGHDDDHKHKGGKD